MLPLTHISNKHWLSSGCKGMEIVASVTPSEFRSSTLSRFSSDMGIPSRVRSFLVDGFPIVVHTDGRRPSGITFKTIRAVYATLQEVYGTCPHESIVVYLRDNPEPKSFPVNRKIHVKDINSGFSWGNLIAVFRNSELHRTLVHEFIHVWHTHSKDFKHHQTLAHRKLNAPPGCLLTESFVEAVTWLLYGGFCTAGLKVKHVITHAAGYLDVKDDGSTNGWAYFVGKAYLVIDGGRMFHDAFFPKGRGVKLMGKAAFDTLIRIMQYFHTTAKILPSKSRFRPVLCACDVGAPYAA